MKVTFRQVDLASGDVQEIQIVDESATKETPATTLINQALMFEAKFDPVIWFIGPPNHPGEPRPVAIQVIEIRHDD